MPLDNEIIGFGVYTPREAARLIGSTPQRVLRWTRGSGPSSPLWTARYQFVEDSTEISFVDLVELRVVEALKAVGIPIQAIRFAISVAQQKYGIERPLSSQGFKTDGGEILMEAVEGDGDFVSLSRKRPGQKVFRDIVFQSLKDLEYEGDFVARWRPHLHSKVVIDPARAFGDPLLDKYGISTSILFNEYKSFNDIEYLSKIYEIPKKEITAAIRFENALEEQAQVKDGQGII
ncbi:helix-turn-helix domain-containing protein [Roseobacter weihaiensis]|uniref:helix-turn-helix domain-containing protein n=1 Tax=Roseobacter weihaiensis TaxID=2763262 RepID=UPI001D0B4FA0|nr:helix-turn-helix domain-containing protein [Roseobacter sp. H9]